jgi:hypothetical protein
LAYIDGGEGIRIWKLPRNGRCGQMKKGLGRKEVKGQVLLGMLREATSLVYKGYLVGQVWLTRGVG